MKPLAPNPFRLMKPSQRILTRLRERGVDTRRMADVEDAMARGLHMGKSRGD